MSYTSQIKEYLKANSIEEDKVYSHVVIQNDGDETGNYIAEWNLEIPQPTNEQLNSYATIAESNEKWSSIRFKRNKLLAETDFYALSDVTMTTEMSNYRQQLRDLPSSTSNPDDVVFPTKPTT